MRRKYFWWKIMASCVTIFIIANCKTPYEPKLNSTGTNLLVVEGYIEGSIPVVMKLSRTRMITNGDTAAHKYELGARVIVEDDKQNSYPLSELGNGIYSSLSNLPLTAANQYRLHIFTTENEEYLSDFVPFKPSPPIDTIGWAIKDGGVQIYVNTHDPNNTTRYYRWEYSETWEYQTLFNSSLEYDAVNNIVIPRTQQINMCWQTDSSTNILLNSTAKLSSDVVNEMPMVYIQPHDVRLSDLYSIRVRQFALDLSGYNYWSAMKSNTESIGTFFDPQPNETVGNIHCETNPAEIVIGYINAGSSVETRIFIGNSSIPPGWRIPLVCPFQVVSDNPDSLIKYFSSELIPVYSVRNPPGYAASSPECVDCRTHGGVPVKPSFWP